MEGFWAWGFGGSVVQGLGWRVEGLEKLHQVCRGPFFAFYCLLLFRQTRETIQNIDDVVDITLVAPN